MVTYFQQLRADAKCITKIKKEPYIMHIHIQGIVNMFCIWLFSQIISYIRTDSFCLITTKNRNKE